MATTVRRAIRVCAPALAFTAMFAGGHAAAEEPAEVSNAAETAGGADEASTRLVDGDAAAWLAGDAEAFRVVMLSPPDCAACEPAEARILAMPDTLFHGHGIERWQLEDEATMDAFLAWAEPSDLPIVFPALLAVEDGAVRDITFPVSEDAVAVFMARVAGAEPAPLVAPTRWPTPDDGLRGSFAGVDLSNVNLSSAVLHHVDASGAGLRGANLRGATLDTVNFAGADLTDAEFEGATIGRVFWGGAVCPDGTNANDHEGTCQGHLAADTHPYSSAPAQNSASR